MQNGIYVVNMVSIIPSRVFFTSGKGTAKMKLEAFELALREARIERFNLVPVSSIVPPHCKIISIEEGLSLMKPGQVVFLVLSRIDSSKAGQTISASVGAAIPKEGYGYLSEYANAEPISTASKKAEELAEHMLSTTKAEHASNITTSSISSSVKVKKGMWSCAVAAAVLL